MTMDPGQRLAAISPTTGLSGLDALALLSDPSADLSRFLPGGGDTTVIINATAVTGDEVVDAMGKYVQENGPLSRQWIGQ